MTQATTFSEFSVMSSQIFKDTLQKPGREFYFFVGNPLPWGSNDLIPENLYDNRKSQAKIWKNMIAVKKVIGSDVTTAFKKMDWVSGTVYDEYRHNYTDIDPAASGATRIRDAKTYVVNNDSLQVFRCIYNNNGAPSTIKPVAPLGDLTLDIFQTGDDYRWKYLFTLQPAAINKFNSPHFYPFTQENLAVKSASINGGIHNIRVVNGGSGFTPSSEFPVFVGGDGDLNKTASGSLTLINGTVFSISITNSGSNYPASKTIPVNIVQPTTNGNIKSCYGLATTNSSGQITSVSIVIGGSSYISGSAFIVSSSCNPIAVTDTLGRIKSFKIFNGQEGRNFNFASAVVVSNTGSNYSLDPIISPVGGHGAVQEYDVNSFNVLINIKLTSDDVDFPINNDFRSFGIVTGLMKNASEAFTDSSGAALPKLIIEPYYVGSPSGEITRDTKLYGQTTGATGTIVDLSIFEGTVTAVSFVRYELDPNFKFEFEESVRTSNNVPLMSYGETPPDFIVGIGSIIYTENRGAVLRSSDQSETITIVIEL